MTEEKEGRKSSTGTHHYARMERERKRGEAEKRQTVYTELSPEQKLALCRNRRGNSEREVKRIELAAKTS